MIIASLLLMWLLTFFLITSLLAEETDTPQPSVVPSGQVVLNFDNADLYEVIRTLAELLNINYMVEPNLRGAITIHTSGQLKKSDLFPVFFQILEANGLTAVKEGNVYKIVPIKDAPKMPIASRFPASEDAAPDERVMIQILTLKYISDQEIVKLLTPFISAEGAIISHKDTNTLVIVDKTVNIRKILKLVEVFDVNLFEKVSHRFYALSHTNSQEMAKSLTDVIAAFGAAKDEVKLIPIERLNLLLVVSSNPQMFDRLEGFIRQLDVAGTDAEPQIYVYPVKNGEAGELAELLNSVFTGIETVKEASGKKEDTQKETKSEKSTVPTPFGNIPKDAKEPELTKTAVRSEKSEASSTLKGKVRITPDKIRNALIIESSPGDYRTIENILKRIDVLPRQVLIEVTIAEITLDAATQLGVEWQYFKGDPPLSTSLISASAGAAGFQYLIGNTARWTQTLTALATQNKVNILSSPTILASDNKEAKIDISSEIPVASAQYKYESGTQPIVQTNIQYRNTGVILSVTPHINEFGLVSMSVNQEVSEQSDTVQVGNDKMASFFKRSLTTSLTVKDGQTIVIGGLIKQTDSKGMSGIPCLGELPFIRYLFGKNETSTKKTELILLITPRVIATLEDVDAVTEEFKTKIGNAINIKSGRKEKGQAE